MTDLEILALARPLAPSGAELALITFEPFNESGVVSSIHIIGSLVPLVEVHAATACEAERRLADVLREMAA